MRILYVFPSTSLPSLQTTRTLDQCPGFGCCPQAKVQANSGLEQCRCGVERSDKDPGATQCSTTSGNAAVLHGMEQKGRWQVAAVHLQAAVAEGVEHQLPLV